MAKKRKRFLARMQTKLFVIVILLTLVFLFLIGRLIYINAKDGKRYEKQCWHSKAMTALKFLTGEAIF